MRCWNRFVSPTPLDIPSNTDTPRQALATGFDENGKVPRNPAESLVRLLNDPALGAAERIRLITIYLLYKDGLLEGDIQKLILHSSLHRKDEVFRQLSFFGARVSKKLKEPPRSRPQRIPPPQSDVDDDEQSDFSRYTTALKQMLEDHVKGTLDPELFPYTQPQMMPTGQDNSPQASLRSAKPTWARSRLSVVEPRQRIIIFMAGGATYSEARDCYEVSKSSVRDVFLGSSHMITPNTWLSQLMKLADKRERLDLPADQPLREVPAQLIDPDPLPKATPPPPQKPAAPRPAAAAPAPPVKEMGGLKVHHAPKVPYYEQETKKKKKKFGGIF